jgi:WD40 repeat protein
MQVEVPQILWHSDSRQIMSIDFYPNSNYLITSSIVTDYDSGIRFWKIKKKP